MDRNLPRRAGCLLPSVRAHAAVRAFGIDKLRQNSPKILVLGRHAEQHALGAHIPVESLDIRDCEAQFDLSRWILVGSRMQGESGAELYSSCRLPTVYLQQHAYCIEPVDTALNL